MNIEDKQKAIKGEISFLLLEKVYIYDPSKKQLTIVRDMIPENRVEYNSEQETKYFKELIKKLKNKRSFPNKPYNKTRNLGTKGMNIAKYSVTNPLSATGYALKGTYKVGSVVGEHTVYGTTRAIGRGVAKIRDTPYQSLIDAMNSLYEEATKVKDLGKEFMAEKIPGELKSTMRNGILSTDTLSESLSQLLTRLDLQVKKSRETQEKLKKDFRALYKANRTRLVDTYNEGINTKDLMILILTKIRTHLTTQMATILAIPATPDKLDTFNGINRARKRWTNYIRMTCTKIRNFLYKKKRILRWNILPRQISTMRSLPQRRR
jgi:hypothetical protein